MRAAQHCVICWKWEFHLIKAIVTFMPDKYGIQNNGLTP